MCSGFLNKLAGMPEFQFKNTICFGDEILTWEDLLSSQRALEFEGRLCGHAYAVVIDSAKDALVVSALAATKNLDIVLVGRERLTSGVRGVLHSRGFELIDLMRENSAPTPTPSDPGRISLLTSGSTGIPKLVSHRWDTLFTASRASNAVLRKWVVPYQTGTYAWFQIVTQGMFLPNQELHFPPRNDPEEVLRCVVTSQANSLSSTPTFWRLAMLRIPRWILDSAPLQFITLGGEMVDQAILNQLRQLYPKAQITHIYASTEAGASVIVKDGMAGFPAAFLDRNDPDLPQLKIKGNTLWIKSPFACLAVDGQSSAWIDSGDLVEQRGDRVYFCGRADQSLINVGGSKAYPADIESAILSHPAIQWCRVRAVKAAFVGELAEADYVVASGMPAPSEQELAAHCSQDLPEYAIPRFWNRMESIPVKPSLKSEL